MGLTAGDEMVKENTVSVSMIKVLHLISSLSAGGAEVMMVKLIKGMDRNRFVNQVVSLTDRGQFAVEVEAAGVSVESLGMKRGWPDLSGLPKLVHLLRKSRPHLVQSWLYHADFLGLLATLLPGSPPMVWNLRCSDMDFSHYPRQTRWIVNALALGSRRPIAVIVNSVAGQRLHQHLGYRPQRWELIPNGFDLERFRPEAAARQRLRAELGVPVDAVLVAFVARVDPMKDHSTFLDAAIQVAKARSFVHFVLIGKDTPLLAPLVARRELADRVFLLGERYDVDRLLPGVDVACLSSTTEGFPNVLGEAMACGVPCVTTDVGDARLIIGDTGLVVLPRDPAALAGAIMNMIERGSAGRQVLGQAARARIEKEYALPRIIERYETLYEDLCGLHRDDYSFPT